MLFKVASAFAYTIDGKFSVEHKKEKYKYKG